MLESTKMLYQITEVNRKTVAIYGTKPYITSILRIFVVSYRQSPSEDAYIWHDIYEVIYPQFHFIVIFLPRISSPKLMLLQYLASRLWESQFALRRRPPEDEIDHRTISYYNLQYNLQQSRFLLYFLPLHGTECPTPAELHAFCICSIFTMECS